MQGLVELLKGWQLHPVVDHFTVALILVGILADLVGSLMPSRLWLRSMATTLIVLGAVAAAGSKLTGGWEAQRVWDNVVGPGKEVLQRHAQLGDRLPWVFGGLAVWRLGLQFLGFMARTRIVYLLAAIAAGGAILYQGALGGDLVYDYGVGTALMSTAAPSPEVSAATPLATPAMPIPTVYVPPATPAVAPSPAGSATPGATVPTTAPAPATTAAAPSPASSASATPTAAPTTASGTEINPPPGGAPASAASVPSPKSATL